MTGVFVTGGAGFIGSHMVDRLLARGDRVVVYDNLSSGVRNNLEAHSGNSSLRFVAGDLLDVPKLLAASSGCDVVFHFAAHSDVRTGENDPAIDLHNGTIATHNVLEAMRLNGIRRIVHASSASVYGEAPGRRLSEDFGPLLPISLYGAGKVAAEALVSAYCHTFDMQAWMFRFANIVGSRRRNGVITDFVNKLRADSSVLEILGDGTQRKPYLHVSECVDGILFGFEHARDRVNLFNLGVDSATDVSTIARTVAREMNLEGVPFHYTGGDRGWKGDAPQLMFDMSSMKRLGWQATLSSDEAVVRSAREIVKELR